MQVIVDNLLTTYDVSGNGPLVLLLHGWGDNRRTYEDLQAELSADHQVVSLDLPGFGQTQAPSEAWDLDNYADFVRKFIDKLSLGQPATVIGHSNGGALAIRALSLGQLKADKLVLLAASGIRQGKSLKRLFWLIVTKVGKLLTFWLPSSIKRRLRVKLYGVAGSDMLVAPALQETFKRTVRQDVQTDARQLTLPTLLVYGEKDQAVPVADGQKYAKLFKDAKLVVIPGADHFVHQTAREQVIKAIREFI